MKKIHFIGLFLLLTVISSSLLVYTVNNIVVSHSQNGTSYEFDTSSSHEFLLIDQPAYYVLSSTYGTATTMVDHSLYSLVRVVESNSTVYKILHLSFNDQFSNITNRSLLPLPLPVNRSLYSYNGLIYYNDSFITMQRVLNYINSSLPAISLFFIRFNFHTILSNYSVPFDPTPFGIVNNGGYDDMLPIQEFNGSLFTLRRIDNYTISDHSSNFILSEYSLPGYSLKSELLISSFSDKLSDSDLHQFSHSLIYGFSIDSQGNFWFSIAQYYSSGSKNFQVKINHHSLQLMGSLSGYSSLRDFSFKSVNVTIQPESLGFQNKTFVVTTGIRSYLVSVSNNYYIEIVKGSLGYDYSNTLLGFRIVPLSVQPLPVLNLVIISSSVIISVIGLIVNYVKFRSHKISENESDLE